MQRVLLNIEKWVNGEMKQEISEQKSTQQNINKFILLFNMRFFWAGWGWAVLNSHIAGRLSFSVDYKYFFCKFYF